MTDDEDITRELALFVADGPHHLRPVRRGRVPAGCRYGYHRLSSQNRPGHIRRHLPAFESPHAKPGGRRCRTQEGRFGPPGRVRQVGRNPVKGERVVQKCRYGRCSGAYARSAGLCVREPAGPLYRRGVAGSTSTAAEARRNTGAAGTHPCKFAGAGKHRPGSVDCKRPPEFQGYCSITIVSPGSSHRRPHLPGKPFVGRQPAPARHCQPDRFEHGDRFCRFDHGADEPYCSRGQPNLWPSGPGGHC